MKKPPESTGKKRGKRSELAEWMERAHPERIGEEEFREIQRALAPVSESYLRKLVRECGVALGPMVEGVCQGNLDELERSLLALMGEYSGGDAARRGAVRRLVITAKDHARWAAKTHPEKEEMLLWMTTWLDNPAVFPEWVRLRRAQISGAESNPL
jgi:hypothetical protein